MPTLMDEIKKKPNVYDTFTPADVASSMKLGEEAKKKRTAVNAPVIAPTFTTPESAMKKAQVATQPLDEGLFANLRAPVEPESAPASLGSATSNFFAKGRPYASDQINESTAKAYDVAGQTAKTQRATLGLKPVTPVPTTTPSLDTMDQPDQTNTPYAPVTSPMAKVAGGSTPQVTYENQNAEADGSPEQYARLGLQSPSRSPVATSMGQVAPSAAAPAKGTLAAPAGLTPQQQFEEQNRQARINMGVGGLGNARTPEERMRALVGRDVSAFGGGTRRAQEARRNTLIGQERDTIANARAENQMNLNRASMLDVQRLKNEPITAQAKIAADNAKAERENRLAIEQGRETAGVKKAEIAGSAHVAGAEASGAVRLARQEQVDAMKQAAIKDPSFKNVSAASEAGFLFGKNKEKEARDSMNSDLAKGMSVYDAARAAGGSIEEFTPEQIQAERGKMLGRGESRAKEMEMENAKIAKLKNMFVNPETGQVEARKGSTTAANKTPVIKTGDIIEGFRFKGGDPNDVNSWEKI